MSELTHTEENRGREAAAKTEGWFRNSKAVTVGIRAGYEGVVT